MAHSLAPGWFARDVVLHSERTRPREWLPGRWPAGRIAGSRAGGVAGWRNLSYAATFAKKPAPASAGKRDGVSIPTGGGFRLRSAASARRGRGGGRSGPGTSPVQGGGARGVGGA